METKILLMKVEIPGYIYSEFIKQSSIDVIVDSWNVVLHNVRLELITL